MKREGFKKNKSTIHGHNECGICSGNYRSKTAIRQRVKNKIKKEMTRITNIFSERESERMM